MKFLEVHLIMVRRGPDDEIRVGRVYRSKKAAQSWRPFVKSCWHGLPTRVQTERIPVINGGTTPEVVDRFSKLYNIDLEGMT